MLIGGNHSDVVIGYNFQTSSSQKLIYVISVMMVQQCWMLHDGVKLFMQTFGII